MSTICLQTHSSVACCDRMSTFNLSLLSTHLLSNKILKMNFINHQRRQRTLQTSALLLTEKILVNNRRTEHNFRISKMSLIICSLNHLSIVGTLTKGREGLLCSAGVHPRQNSRLRPALKSYGQAVREKGRLSVFPRKVTYRIQTLTCRLSLISSTDKLAEGDSLESVLCDETWKPLHLQHYCYAVMARS